MRIDVAAFVSAFEAKPKRSTAEYLTMEMLGYAAAYSPRSATAFDVDLPFDARTGELDDSVFARWLAFDPAERVATRRAELARLRFRYLDCGRRDEYGLDIGARSLPPSACAMRGSTCGTRNSRTTIATWDTDMQSHCRH